MADRSKLAGGRFNKQRNFTKRKKPFIFFQKVNINETRPSLSKFLNCNLLHRIPMLERTLKGHLVPFQAFRKEKTKRTGNKEKGNLKNLDSSPVSATNPFDLEHITSSSSNSMFLYMRCIHQTRLYIRFHPK